MKYFKNHNREEDYYFVVFNCSRKSEAFTNYLKALASYGKDSENYMFHSKVIDLRDCQGWAKSYREETKGYTCVYGFDLLLKIITDFIALMED